MAHFVVDGHHVHFSKAEELVSWMHEHSFTQAADDKAFMMDVSDRTVLQSGEKIRFGNAAEFVNDLVRHGLIRRIKVFAG